MDISQEAFFARMSVVDAMAVMTAPHVLMRPRVFADGNAWCALYGENLAVGVSGFGATPHEACAAFDKAWASSPTPAAAFAKHPAMEWRLSDETREQLAEIDRHTIVGPRA